MNARNRTTAQVKMTQKNFPLKQQEYYGQEECENASKHVFNHSRGEKNNFLMT